MYKIVLYQKRGVFPDPILDPKNGALLGGGE
jgi:hypothetical protein